MEHKKTNERKIPKSPTSPLKVENAHLPHLVKQLSN